MPEKRKKIPPTERVIRTFFHPIFKMIWKPELVDKKEYLPIEGPCFVYGNHSHNYDPFIMNILYSVGEVHHRGINTRIFQREDIQKSHDRDWLDSNPKTCS